MESTLFAAVVSPVLALTDIRSLLGECPLRG